MCPHSRSRGKSRSLSQQHQLPRELLGPAQCPSPEGRVIPSAPPWPGFSEPRGEEGSGGRPQMGSLRDGHPSPTQLLVHGAVDLILGDLIPLAPGWQPPAPSLSSSGKRHWTGWPSISEQPCHGRGQQRGPGTAHAQFLHLGGQTQPLGTQGSQTTRTAQTMGWMNGQTDGSPACTALTVYFWLARSCAAGRCGGGCSGALLPRLWAVQPVLGDGAGVAGLHRVHPLGAQIDAVILVWEERETAVRAVGHCQPSLPALGTFPPRPQLRDVAEQEETSPCPGSPGSASHPDPATPDSPPTKK